MAQMDVIRLIEGSLSDEDHQVLDRSYWFRHEIGIKEAKELIDQL